MYYLIEKDRQGVYMKSWIICFCMMFFFSVSLAAPVKGSFKDSRDGKTYKTVKLGNQTWMAENLNLHMDDSWCYERKIENCKKYGRLYTWKKAEKACPAGWHLPSRSEWRDLVSYVSENAKSKPGVSLRTKDDWKVKKKKKKIFDQRTGEPIYLDEYEVINAGADSFGFSALPAGYVSKGGNRSDKIKERGLFWSSSKEKGKKNKKAYARMLEFGDENFHENKYSTDNAFSVRCLKD